MLVGNHRVEIAGTSNAGVKELRLKNLLDLVGQRGWKPADLVREVGKSPSYWSDMLRGAKGFGEAVAREIEDELGLPRFWLDTDHERGEAPPVRAAASLGDMLTELARQIAKRPEIERQMLASVLPRLATAPGVREETCAYIMRLLEPGNDFQYTMTWEEAARAGAVELGEAKVTAGEFIAKVDKDQGKNIKTAMVASPHKRTAQR